MLNFHSEWRLFTEISFHILWIMKLFWEKYDYDEHKMYIQSDLFDSSSGNRLLWACFDTSEGLKGINVTQRLGANYYLVRNTLKWHLE